MPTPYSPSGRVGSNTFLLLIPMLASAGLLGAVYGVAMHFIPVMIIDAALVIGFVFASGWAAQIVLRVGKCRSPAFAIFYGVLAGAVAIALSHYVVFELSIRNLPTRPTFMQYLDWRVKTGWRVGRGSSFGRGMHIVGSLVWICWTAEALMVLIGSALLARKQTSEPFCESCERWALRSPLTFSAPGLSAATVERMRSGSLEEILSPPLSEIDHVRSQLRYRVRTCPSCQASNYLDLEHALVTTDKKGKATESTTRVGPTLQLAPEELEAVRQLGEDISAILAAKLADDAQPSLDQPQAKRS